LALLHRFQKGALHLRGGPVDFVCKDQIGEQRALFGGEFSRARIVNQGADQVGGKKIGSELDPLEPGLDAGG